MQKKKMLIFGAALISAMAVLGGIVRSAVAAKGEFDAEGSELPYDAEVEYLESTGLEFIETDIPDYPKQNRAEIVFSMFGTGVRNTNLIGSYGQAFNYVSFRYANRTYYYGNRGATTPLLPCTSGDVHVGTYEYADGAVLFSLDGESATYETTLISQGYMFSLLGMRGSSAANLTGRIYGFKVVERDGGAIVADLHPVRFTDKNGVDEGAMYDRVSGKLYRNSGDGSFIIGPDL